jgi:hypothetical protein
MPSSACKHVLSTTAIVFKSQLQARKQTDIGEYSGVFTPKMKQRLADFFKKNITTKSESTRHSNSGIRQAHNIIHNGCLWEIIRFLDIYRIY